MRSRITFVYVYLGEEPVPAGRLEMIEDGRNSHAIFQYGERYVRRSDRIPIDPAMLAFQKSGSEWVFRTPKDFPLFNGIRDASPDGWGRYVMHKAAGSALDEFDYLVATGEHRVGALAFGPNPTDGPKRQAPWGDGDVGDYFHLEALAEAAERIQEVELLSPELRRFLEPGTSLGGARPKAATDYKGAPWIAKFAAKDDTYPVCRTEYATMRLAKECGLDVPNIDIKNFFGRDIYLIKRFDRIKEGNKLFRLSYASGLTLLEALDVASHTYGYHDLAGAIRRYGYQPREDLRELYRRMAFNILVGNDDDHLRNHAFLYEEKGWRLSPLYDVVPKPRVGLESSQALAVNGNDHTATLTNALLAAPAFGLIEGEAAEILENLRLQVLARWREAFAEAGLSERDIEKLTNSFVQTERPIESNSANTS